MEQNSTTGETADTTLFAGDAWFDPIEAGIRERIRGIARTRVETIGRCLPSEWSAPLAVDRIKLLF